MFYCNLKEKDCFRRITNSKKKEIFICEISIIIIIIIIIFDLLKISINRACATKNEVAKREILVGSFQQLVYRSFYAQV